MRTHHPAHAGSEVTPFAVVTDASSGTKYPLADYSLTPSMAIVDPQLVAHMPRRLTANGGIDAVRYAYRVGLPYDLFLERENHNRIARSLGPAATC